MFPSTPPLRAGGVVGMIESVRAVSLATQRVVRELEAVTVYAAREGDLAGLAATDGNCLRRPAAACGYPASTGSCSS